MDWINPLGHPINAANNGFLLPFCVLINAVAFKLYKISHFQYSRSFVSWKIIKTSVIIRPKKKNPNELQYNRSWQVVSFVLIYCDLFASKKIAHKYFICCFCIIIGFIYSIINFDVHALIFPLWIYFFRIRFLFFLFRIKMIVFIFLHIKLPNCN